MQAKPNPQSIVPDEWPDDRTQSASAVIARQVAAHVRLCLQHRNWSGAIGNWSGTGTGSSIDFQDHRPYLPGDDPRYIDWAAYARSGHYSMKLYREEVSPRLDIMLDLSRSMTWRPGKRNRMLELASFCMESGSALGASPHVYAVSGSAWQPFDFDSARSGKWKRPSIIQSVGAPEISRIPLSNGSLRILISDLLFDHPPAEIIRTLVAGRGRAAIFVPYLDEEIKPDWTGNLELVDCETRQLRRQRVDRDLLNRYQSAYQRHFAAWRESARRYDVRMARITCEGSMKDALYAEAFSHGVIEAWT